MNGRATRWCLAGAVLAAALALLLWGCRSGWDCPDGTVPTVWGCRDAQQPMDPAAG